MEKTMSVETRKQQIKAALNELCPSNLVEHHVLYYGCSGLNEPCMYSNGPAFCSVPSDGLGGCPFGQASQDIDRKYVEVRLNLLKSLGADEKTLLQAENFVCISEDVVKKREREFNASI